MWEILARLTPFAELKNPHAIIKYVGVDKGRPRLSDIPQNTNQAVTMDKPAHRPDDQVLG
jgi:hypothetical protein